MSQARTSGAAIMAQASFCGSHHLRIQTEDFDLSSEVARLRAGERGVGAVCAFVDTVRDRNDSQAVSTMALEAQRRGIHRAFLQVDGSNTSALALYRRAGMTTAWSYAYWRLSITD